jgi:hypothetical protein
LNGDGDGDGYGHTMDFFVVVVSYDKSIVKNACKVEEDKVLVVVVEESSSNLCLRTEEKTILFCGTQQTDQ